MTIKRIPLANIPREQWLESRKLYVNASETPIVVGESTWGSLADLYASKKGLRPPLEDNAVLKKGRWAEAAVFEAIADEYPEWKVLRAKVQVIDEEKRQACTPDGFAETLDRPGIGVVQAKVVSRTVFRRKWLNDFDDPGVYAAATPPAAYRIQTLHEMMLNETSWGILAVLINGEYSLDLRIFEIERNAEMEDRIDYRIADFFERYLDAGIMPPFEPQRDDLLVKQLYPRDLGTAIDLSSDNRVMVAVEDLIEARATKKRGEKLEKAAKTELAGKLMNHSYGLLPDGRCLSFKQHHRKAYTVEATDYRIMNILKNLPEDLEDD
jgi:predicted phage-related endonuclease